MAPARFTLKTVMCGLLFASLATWVASEGIYYTFLCKGSKGSNATTIDPSLWPKCDDGNPASCTFTNPDDTTVPGSPNCKSGSVTYQENACAKKNTICFTAKV